MFLITETRIVSSIDQPYGEETLIHGCCDSLDEAHDWINRKAEPPYKSVVTSSDWEDEFSYSISSYSTITDERYETTYDITPIKHISHAS